MTVFPGVVDTLERPRRSVRRLTNEDLPTLDRPIKANSGKEVWGNDSGDRALTTNSADLIFMGRRALESPWAMEKRTTPPHGGRPYITAWKDKSQHIAK